MKDFKVSKKLFISYAAIMILFVVSCFVSITDFVSLGKQIEAFYTGPFTVNESASIINSNFERMQKAVYRSISNTDPEITSEAIANARECAVAIQEQVPVVKSHFKGDQQIIDRLEAALEKLEPMRETVLSLAAENKNAEAADYMEHNNILVIHEAQEQLNQLIESGNRMGASLVSGLKEKQARAVVSLILLGSASMAVSIVFGIYITRGITRPVRELEQAALAILVFVVRAELSLCDDILTHIGCCHI